MERKKTREKNSLPKSEFNNLVLDIFSKTPGKQLNYKQVSKALNITSANSRKTIIDVLDNLSESNHLKKMDHGKYKLVMADKFIIGKIDFAASGAAFVTTDQFSRDVFVNSRDTLNALNGDVVELKITRFGKSGKRPEGKVIAVTQRHKTEFVGILEVSEKYAFLIADDSKIHVDFFIPRDKLNNGKNGEKAIIKLLDWPDPKSSPIGKITEVLGMPGDNNVEMRSILANKGFTTGFPEPVMQEAEEIPVEITASEISKRKDFRETLTFTIDPLDAQDFDDALSFQKLENDLYEIGVHIADVTHYVHPGTELDSEAINRATSVYLVDRVIPMLPEKLSNGVCSLRPNEDKLCFSTVFKMDGNANILDTWIGKTVIHSDKRFTYEDVQEVIENKAGLYVDEVLILDGLAKTLREKRTREGSITFDKVEVRFRLDEEGKPAGVYFKHQKDAHKLIEDFMLLANKSVAHFVSNLSNKKKTYVYRVHDNPDPAKISSFNQFIGKFGYKLNEKNLQNSINNLLTQVKGKPEENVIETLAIRSMAKAVYTTKNIGHYGLGFSHYSHFTSPIRRYPDVMAHRLLWNYLNENNPVNEEEIEELCKHSSEMERAAVEAERDSTKYFQALYLSERVGQIFDGLISGVSDFGIFVELVENKCEGLIRLADLKNDYYSFDEDNFRVVGNNTRKVYQLGQKVTVLVKNVNLSKKQMSFELVE